ncbi:putative gag-pol polyprotein, partial [Trifolium pratense]
MPGRIVLARQFERVVGLKDDRRVVATATVEVTWLSNLLSELQVLMANPPKILSNNVGATYLSANPVLHSRMKHISMDYHFVREQ